MDRESRPPGQQPPTTRSAIWTALSAAPLRRLSPQANRRSESGRPSGGGPSDEHVVDPGRLQRLGYMSRLGSSRTCTHGAVESTFAGLGRRDRPLERRVQAHAVPHRHRHRTQVAEISSPASDTIRFASRATLISYMTDRAVGAFQTVSAIRPIALSDRFRRGLYL